MMNKRRQEITRRYRKVCWGRLYWNSKNSRFRRLFDAGDVAVIVTTTGLRIHYWTLDALVNEIESMEREQYRAKNEH